MENSESNLILNLTQKLLDSISNKDWETYKNICDPNFSCIEPETGNSIYEGLELHKTFFDITKSDKMTFKENMLQPLVKVYGDSAYICYKRVKQISNQETGKVDYQITAETRIWNKIENEWKMVHFHRS
jgi:calcium/calmodulin-dependent protein kinase (CaM kinase) II